MISPSQRPLPDNTQHSQQTNIHALGGIRTHNLSRRATEDLRLRPRGHWDRCNIHYHGVIRSETQGKLLLLKNLKHIPNSEPFNQHFGGELYIGCDSRQYKYKKKAENICTKTSRGFDWRFDRYIVPWRQQQTANQSRSMFYKGRNVTYTALGTQSSSIHVSFSWLIWLCDS